MFNVLISCAGRRSYLVEYFQEALAGRGKVIATNMIADSPAMLVADEAIALPASHEPDYVPMLLEICRDYQVRMLLSAHDLDTVYLAAHKRQFEAIGVLPLIAEPEFAKIAYDKYLTLDFLVAHGFAFCPAALNLDHALAMLAEGEIAYPLIVKPRTGFGSIGLHVVHDELDLHSAFRQLRRSILETPIVNSEGFRLDDSIMIQQFVSGQEYGIDVVNDLKGEVAAVFVEKKLAMRSGETDKAVIVDDKLLHELGERLGGVCKHPAVLDVDVIVSDGIPYILEMNARFGGHYPFAHLAGANVPAALIAWAEGREANPAWLKAEFGSWGYKDLRPIRGG